MKKIPKKIIIGIAVVLLIVGGLFLNKKENKNIITEEKPSPPSLSNQIVVDVKGEVFRPGLYYLDGNARVYDAIVEAG